MTRRKGGARRASTPGRQTSVTGLTDDWMAVARNFADANRMTLRRVYDEAIEELRSRVARGEAVVLRPSEPGTGLKSRPVRVTPEVFDAWVGLSSKVRVHQSVLFVQAVKDYLGSRGAVPDEKQVTRSEQ